MRAICVSMSKQEQVLDSYLLRVFNGQLVEKSTVKTVRFPVENLEINPAWTLQRFKDFCTACVSDKKTLRMYRARLIPKKGEKYVE